MRILGGRCSEPNFRPKTQRRRAARRIPTPLWLAKTLFAFFLMLSGVSVLWGDFDLTQWKYFKSIEVIGVEGKQWIAVRLDNDVIGNSEILERELRVIEGRSAEVPFYMATDRDEMGEAKKLDLTLLNQAVVEGRYQQFVCDLGSSGKTTNQILIETPNHDFVRRADVQGSDDLKHWLSLAKGLHVFDWAEGRTLKLQFPDATYRYLKVILWLDGEKPLEIQGAAVLRTIVRKGRLEAVGVKVLSKTLITPEKFSEWVYDFGQGRPLVSRLSFHVTNKNFRRRVELATSDDASHWVPGPQLEVFRVTADQQEDEFTSLESNALLHRYLRVRVFNGDDRPLEVTGMDFQRFVRQAVFEFDPQKSYRLFFNNPSAHAPSYDLTAINLSSGWDTLSSGKLASLETNRDYVEIKDRQPWTERHPYLLWGVLVFIAALLAVLMFKSVKSMGKKA